MNGLHGLRQRWSGWSLWVASLVAAGTIAAGIQLLAQAPPESPFGEGSTIHEFGDTGWPRTITSQGATVSAYQPQLETWKDNLLTGSAAVSVRTKASPEPIFGIVGLSARTEVDRESRMVTLEDLKITKANFPSAPDKADELLAAIKDKIAAGTRHVALDRLQANLNVSQAETGGSKLPLKNEPPIILVSTKPALLVLVDGKPVMRQVMGTNFLRAINTWALLLLDQGSGQYYLHVMDRWVTAAGVQGPWTVASNPPTGLEAIKKQLSENSNVDLLDDPAPDLKAAMEQGTMPTIYVATDPTELIEIHGQPEMASIDGTQLLWVKNTSSEIILDVSSQYYYALISGRWFRSKSLGGGTWEFVPGNKVPADFSKIPENHPKGDVLAAVSGTTQAKESLIANTIPQTATVKRSEAKIAPVYDGEPQFQPIEGTQMQYAVNSPTPVILVSPQVYYAVENGVWFSATAPAGPWAVATSVPAPIYTIPPSSPLYYVTNVQVYGSTPDVVYCGYTPGYYGTCLAPYGCVVYGTGWAYRPWIGTAWYGRPWSYGFACGFHYSSVGGWSFGFAAGAGRQWWGPGGWHAGWGGTWREGWGAGWGGRYTNVHASSVHMNNFNCYNRWGGNTIVNRNTNVNVNNTNINRNTNINNVNNRNTNINNTNINRNTNVNNIRNTNVTNRDTNITSGRALNNVYAGKDGNVYRRGDAGWEQHSAEGWKQTSAGGVQRSQQWEGTHQQLNNDFSARRTGETNFTNFRNGGEFGGYGGYRSESVGGYRSESFSGYRAGGFGGGGGRRR